MSALVVTVLIAIVWGAVAAAGYVRGGWREVVTLAGVLLSGAMLAEWAAPNGADLAGLFGGDVYRSSTFVAFLYLIGGTLLLGYFGGSRLPRPDPLSATERFAGGALGFFNGGLLAALALRALRTHTFRPGDSAALAETPLATFLTGNVGYLIAAAMLAGIVALFASVFLLRGPRSTAEYAEEPSYAAAPYMPQTPQMPTAPDMQEGYRPLPAAPAQPVPRPAFAAPFAPPPAVPYLPPMRPVPPPGSEGRNIPPPGAAATPPRAQSLIPAAPMAPTIAVAATLPTPALPPAPAEPAPRPDPTDDAMPAVAVAVPPPAEAPASAPEPPPAVPWFVVPPGFDITASQPLPVVAGRDGDAPVPFSLARKTASDAGTPPVVVTAPDETSDDTPAEAEAETLPAPVESFAVERSPSLPVETDGLPIVLLPDTHEPDARTAAPEDPVPEGLHTDAKTSPAPPLPERETSESEPAPEKGEPDTAPRIARARVAAVRQPPAPSKPLHMTVPSALQRPIQPGPQMHPCPVCDYPVRNEARFCPNCGTAQPVPATYSG